MDPLYIFTVLIVFCGFWLVSAVHKIRKQNWFRAVLLDYELFPKSLIGVIAVCVPLAELVIAVLLLVLPKAGALASSALLTIYALLLAFNVLRRHEMNDCGCGWGDSLRSNTSSPPQWNFVFRNIGLAVLSLLILAPVSVRSLTILDYGNASLMAMCLAGLALAGSHLVSNYIKMKEVGYV